MYRWEKHERKPFKVEDSGSLLDLGAAAGGAGISTRAAGRDAATPAPSSTDQDQPGPVSQNVCQRYACACEVAPTNLARRVVFALFIISKAGGLIYNREFHSGMSKLTSNDYLMLAGSFHG